MKKIMVPTIVVLLLFLTLGQSAHCQQTISKNQLVSDSIPTNSYKLYNLTEQLPKGCLFSIHFRVDEGRYGTVTLQRGTEIVYSWTVFTEPLMGTFLTQYYYTVFITRSGSYSLNVTNTDWSERLNYTFFYDVSDPLQANNTKSIPTEGGMVSYHVDLEAGDKVSLNLTSPTGSDFDMQVFYGYSYMMMLSPAIASSISSDPSETLSFKADNKGRYFISVTSVAGNGTFNLQSSITQIPSYEEIQSNYNLLNLSFQNLQADYNSLQNELGNLKVATYALTAITVVAIATTVHFATRKPKLKTEPTQ